MEEQKQKIFHVIYPLDAQGKKWAVRECEGLTGIGKWEMSNPGTRRVSFLIAPKNNSGDYRVDTLADARAQAKPGDRIIPKVNGETTSAILMVLSAIDIK